MNLKLKILVLCLAAILLFLLARLVRRGRIRPEYSLLWLAGLVVAMILVSLDGLVIWMCGLLGPDVVPFSLLTLAALLSLGATCLHLCMRVSILREESRILCQRLAHLDQKMLESGLTPDASPDAQVHSPEDAPDA